MDAPLVLLYVICAISPNAAKSCLGAPYHSSIRNTNSVNIHEGSKIITITKSSTNQNQHISNSDLKTHSNFSPTSYKVRQGDQESGNSIRWPDGKIPYLFEPSFPEDYKKMVISGMLQIEQAVVSSTTAASPSCIRFVERTDEAHYLRIFQGSGCKAAIGYQKGQGQNINNMSLGQGCLTKGTILHELMHVLGFYHEQNRPDRNNYVTVNFTNTDKENLVDFEAFPSSIVETFGLPYDYGSITHYGPYQKAIDPAIPVIQPKYSLGKDLVMGQREDLSFYDISKIRKAYNCPEDIPSPVFFKLQTPTRYIVNCHFSTTVCNMEQEQSSKIQWMITHGPFLNGPYAGHSTGKDSFLLAGRDSVTSGGKPARITTPLSRGGPICLDFYLYQKGPASYLNIVASGPKVKTATVRSFRGVNSNFWKRILLTVKVAERVKIRVILEAYVTVGVVAIDDFRMYAGKCGG